MVSVRKTKQAEKYPTDVSMVLVLVDEIRKLLGYDDSWRFKLTFKTLGKDIIAACDTAWEYRYADIDVNLERAHAQPNPTQALRLAVLHEMLHVPLWQVHELLERVVRMLPSKYYGELYEAIRQCEESTVTFFEHAPIWDELLKGGGSGNSRDN